MSKTFRSIIKLGYNKLKLIRETKNRTVLREENIEDLKIRKKAKDINSYDTHWISDIGKLDNYVERICISYLEYKGSDFVINKISKKRNVSYSVAKTMLDLYLSYKKKG